MKASRPKKFFLCEASSVNARRVSTTELREACRAGIMIKIDYINALDTYYTILFFEDHAAGPDEVPSASRRRTLQTTDRSTDRHR